MPTRLPRAWAAAYAAVWAATLGFAVLVAAAGAPLTTPVRRLLGLRLMASVNPPPDLSRVMALTAHNLPIAAWPILLGVLGAHRHRLTIRIADTVLLVTLTANVLPVGAALGAYGTALLPYVPQLPAEWAGLALGSGAWLVQRRAPLTVKEGVVWFALTGYVLFCAAVFETFGVPHR
jgi:hypothetical protein